MAALGAMPARALSTADGVRGEAGCWRAQLAALSSIIPHPQRPPAFLRGMPGAKPEINALHSPLLSASARERSAGGRPTADHGGATVTSSDHPAQGDSGCSHPL